MPLILTPFRFYNFRIWCGANLVSTTGAWMQVLAANWLLLTLTGSAMRMGLGVVMNAVPILLLAPLGGALADRLRPRPLLTFTQVLHMLIALALALVASADGDVTLWVYGALLAGGIVTAVEGPAVGRFGSTMVDREHLGPALAVGSVAGSAGRIVGMSLGGALIATTGPVPAFLINAATFLVVITALYLLRPAALGVVGVDPAAQAAPAGGPVPTGVWQGMRYVLRDPMVVITLALAFLLGSLGRNYNVTMAAMSAGPLGGGADAYGMLSTVFAVGAVIGGLLSARAGKMYGRHLVAVGGVMSLLQLLSGMAPSLWTFAALMFPIATAAVVVDTVVSTRLQLDQPLAVRGRVLAAVGTTGAIAGAVGAPALGWLSDTLGPRNALLLAGVVTTLGCVVAGLAYAAVRRRRVATPPVWSQAPIPLAEIAGDAVVVGARRQATASTVDDDRERLGAPARETVAAQPATRLGVARVPHPRAA